MMTFFKSKHIKTTNKKGESVEVYYTSIYGEDNYTLIKKDNVEIKTGLGFETLEKCINYDYK